MRTVITKRLEFDAGHRLVNHEGKCRNLHGHRWAVEVTISAPSRDAVGRVIDFGEVKKVLGQWIDEHLDHNMILNEDDKEVIAAVSQWCRDGKPYIVNFNPTSENLAEHLFMKFNELLGKWNSFHGLARPEGALGVTLERLVLFETPTSSAEVST